MNSELAAAHVKNISNLLKQIQSDRADAQVTLDALGSRIDGLKLRLHKAYTEQDPDARALAIQLARSATLGIDASGSLLGIVTPGICSKIRELSDLINDMETTGWT